MPDNAPEAFPPPERLPIPFWLEVLDIRQDEPAAHDTLLRVAYHDHPDVRALAVHTLGQVYAAVPGPRILRAGGRPVPLDNPGGGTPSRSS